MKTNKLVIGILAHVDAGKTTLAESMLYLGGSIRKLGRVDHQDAFLDTYELERARGITIFSKQAQMTLADKDITLLDTPGHIDFSAEMERTLQVLDYAILVVNGADGVQGHTRTLWKLLKKYAIPVFLFINKMDQPAADREQLVRELKQKLDENCVDFRQPPAELAEQLAMCDEVLMEQYLEQNQLADEAIRTAIIDRQVFPCYFGSALKVEGVQEFLEGMAVYTDVPDYPADFGARVYKISRDDAGNRLTYLKITGGTLKVKDSIADKGKINQIRLYSGDRYEAIDAVSAGMVCAVTGLADTYCGEGLGIEEGRAVPILEPVLTYQLILPDGCNVYDMYSKLCQLKEEDPQLHIVWQEEQNEIHLQVMGEVQMEILQSQILERFQVAVAFGAESIVYKETIEAPVEGVGHFEPLRHYAEVHLLLEPAPRGSGLLFDSNCSEDILARNWQNLVLTHLQERQHKGVLTGADITDMKITLIAGRAHQKHTEGGDFRQATYRAVRQGLKRARSILLEPVYEFTLEIPAAQVGRALSDIQRMHGEMEAPQITGENAVLVGTAPVAAMRGYQREVIAYTSGLGRLFCTLKGYQPCHNAAEVIAQSGYDSEQDQDNPTGSVFCAHGAGFVVEWDKVHEYMHLDYVLKAKAAPAVKTQAAMQVGSKPVDDEELEEIFRRTYGDIRQKRSGWNKSRHSYGYPTGQKVREQEEKREYLLVDGYNIIFAWEELKELARANLDGARGKLADILCNYQGIKRNTLILVFDAYKVAGNQGEIEKYHNIYIVYTKEAETADQYIEKATHEIAGKHHVAVATSDAMEQMITWGRGAIRLSAQDLRAELKAADIEIRSYLQDGSSKNRLFDALPEDISELVEDVRLGKKRFDEKE